MADKKVSELDAIAGSATAADDLFLIVDASGSVTKKITRAELNNAIEQDVLSTVDINGGTIDSTVIGGTTPAAGDFTTLGATGNITVGGTVDGRDVAADGTKLDGIEAAATADQTASEIRTLVASATDSNVFDDASHTKLNGIEASADVTDATNVAAAGALMTSGGTVTGDINFGDNDKAIFGAGSDLQIYHDGSHSIIKDAGTGNLQINAGNLNINNVANSANMIVANDGGAVKLFHNGSNKLETTSSGVSVTGGGTFSSSSSGEFNALTISQANNTSGNESRISFKRTTDAGSDREVAAIVADRVGGNDTALVFETNTDGSDGAVERVRITQDGNVGIGTTSPSDALHIKTTADADIGLQVQNDDTQAFCKVQSGGTALYGGNGGVNFVSGSGYATRMHIASGGNVGIGTASPTSSSGGKLLAIETTADEHTNLVFNTANTGRNGIIEGRRTGRSGSERFAQINIQNNSDSGEIRFYTASFGNDVSERARLSSAGVLLIGKTADSIANNGISLAGSATGGGNLSVTNDGNSCVSLNRKTSDGTIMSFRKNGSVVGSVSTTGSGTTYNTTSDIRLKQDIEPLAATDKLMQMNPVSYAWKADPDGPRSMGFIAQEMQEVMPEAVSTGDDDDAMMSMDYGRITPILVSALQDAHRKIEDLESRIAALEAN